MNRTCNSVNLVRAYIILSLFFGGASEAKADDYWRDLSPKLRRSIEAEPYDSARDSGVCELYLQNLRYFAGRGLAMSCGQPIAPTMGNSLKPMEWETVDPDLYPELFKALVSKFGARREGEATQARLREQRDRIKRKEVLFRRAKISLRGFPSALNDDSGKAPSEAAFQIV
jgi:hypothetical protein